MARRFIVPLLACLTGLAILSLWLPRVHPAATWGFRIGRDEAIARARSLAQAQGLPAAGWDALVTARYTERLEEYRRRHPEDAAARSISPASVRVLLLSPDRKSSFTADLQPSGAPAGWELRQPPPPGPPRFGQMPVAEAVAAAAEQLLAGSEAGNYRLTTRGANTKEGLRFTWERAVPGPVFQPTVDAVVRNGQVVHAEIHRSYSQQSETEDTAKRAAAGWVRVVYFIQYFIVLMSAGVLYTLGSMRRLVRHWFALLLAALDTGVVALGMLLGPNVETVKLQAVLDHTTTVVGLYGLFFAVFSSFGLAWVVTGAGLFASGEIRQKWWSLRLLLSRRLFSKPVGLSLCAGLLWSPLLAAVPVIASALVPGAQWNLGDLAEMFSRFPSIQTLYYPFHPTVIAYFGFLFAIVWTRVASRPLRWAVLGITGVLFFSGYENAFSISTVANVLTGVMMFAVVIELFRRFDLLAVLVAETGKMIFSVLPVMLLQPSAAWRSMAYHVLGISAVLLTGGVLLLWKAPDTEDAEAAPEGPLARGIRSEREELKAEFTVAQRAQREMLPLRPPAIPGYALAAHCTPAKDVGGDLYDFVPFDDGRLGIAVADVSGKGVPAALYMTLTKGLLAATTQDHLDLPVIMEQINGHLYTVGRRKTFVTMAFGILDPAGKTLEYARAGHNPAVWRRPAIGSTTYVTGGGMGLGITGGKAFGRALTVQTLNLESGDTLVFYSDGLTEAMNPALEQFGEDRLLEISSQIDDLSAAGARDAILAEVTRFLDGNHPQDDLTLVVLRVE